jgi:putative oxidoreductase
MIHSLRKQLFELSFGLFLIRVGAGLVFFMHGVNKLMAMSATTNMFVHMGLPGWVAPAIAFLETVGGAALVLGIFTRVFALLLGIEMLVAIFLTGGIGKGWPQHELEAFLMAVSFGLVYTGSGKLSLWHWDPKIDR